MTLCLCSLARTIATNGQEACTHFERVAESAVEISDASLAELASSSLTSDIRQASSETHSKDPCKSLGNFRGLRGCATILCSLHELIVSPYLIVAITGCKTAEVNDVILTNFITCRHVTLVKAMPETGRTHQAGLGGSCASIKIDNCERHCSFKNHMLADLTQTLN